MESSQAHERVINILVKQIFSRQLKPGDKLPSERQLAQEMEVDRASLRIGLKYLEMMNVLNIRQGDGIYVRDYIKGASLDFLRILFLQSETSDGESPMDPYIMDEIWEFWVMFLPEMLKLAAKRHQSRDLKALMDIFDEELANLHNREYLVELELKSQELIAETANNIVVILISHTSRPIRKKMIEFFFSSLDEEHIKNHIEAKKNMLRFHLTSPIEDSLSLIEQYRELLNTYRLTLRKLLFPDPDSASKNKERSSRR